MYEEVETKVQKNWDTRETGVINYCWKYFYDLLIICKINSQNTEARSIPFQYHKLVRKTESNDTEISRNLEKKFPGVENICLSFLEYLIFNLAIAGILW